MTVTKATIKQAKADFKSRGRPSLSDREKRQLERSIQLDRRAWSIQDREKKKAEATLLKKQEREKLELERRQRVQMGSQRRCDRFGYKSSQFHLKAFFGGGSVKQDVAKVPAVQIQEDDVFDDDDLDDNTLLEALHSSDPAEESGQAEPHNAAVAIATRPTIAPQLCAGSHQSTLLNDDFLDFCNELGSGTQIARELDSDDKQPTTLKTAVYVVLPAQPLSKTLAPRAVATHNITSVPAPSIDNVKTTNDRKLMPPPALPLKPRVSTVREFKIPSKDALVIHRPSQRALPVVTASPSFSLKELEDFVDDDLQLTQIPAG